jgi:hypothetical protein
MNYSHPRRGSVSQIAEFIDVILLAHVALATRTVIGLPIVVLPSSNST